MGRGGGIREPPLEPGVGGGVWRWEVGGGQASGAVPRARGRGCPRQRARAKPFAAAPVTPAAAAAWPASGPGSRPGCSLSCTSSSGGGEGLDRQPAGEGRGEGAGRSTPSPSTAPEIQTRLGVAGAAPRKSTRRLSAAGRGAAGAPHPPQPQPRFLPRGPGLGQRPQALWAAPHRQPERRGQPAPGPAAPPRPSRAGNTPTSPGQPRLSAPCPRPGERAAGGTT